MLIGDIVAGNARRIAGRQALIFGDEHFTWAQLNDRVNRLANGLESLGLEPGARVASVINNSHQFVELFFALAKIGAVSVPLVPGSVGREIAFAANDVGAQMLIAGPEYVAEAEAVRGDLKTVQFIAGLGEDHPFAESLEAIREAGQPTEPDHLPDADDIYAIKYTSGTTGFPKGCMHTHRQHLSNVVNILAHVPHLDDDRATVSSPLSADFGISMLVIYACRGIPTYLLPKFDVVQLLSCIERERITLAYAIGATFDPFANYPQLGEFDLSSLRRFTGSSAANHSREGMRRLRAQAGFTAGFFNAYGSSETGGYITFHQADELEREMNDDALAHRLESLGREAQFSFIDCLDDDLNPVGVGEVGEMVVRSPSTFSGYWNLEEETAQVLRDGRLFTGDLISKDEDGYIYFQGRKRDIIKSGGLIPIFKKNHR